VTDDLDGAIDLILDGGATSVGLESTIVDFSGASPRLLRSGGIARAEIEKVAGRLSSTDTNEIFAPGMMASHYAPRTAMRLDANDVRANEALLAFGAQMPANAGQAVKILNLSPRGDVIEAAANLYAQLRALDLVNASAIAVAPIPQEGLGEAIRDRLQRAAAPRPLRGNL
jgi:L-threonylcarbamoyladenylate synthase